MELNLMYRTEGLKITAESHDGDVWESKTFDPVEMIIKIFKCSNEAERKDIMAIDFSAFDEKIDLNELQKDVIEAKIDDFEEVPNGNYIVTIEKMELTLTKETNKPMFMVQCEIKEGEQKGRSIFFNRVIGGNKNSEKWNDGKAIKSVITWLEKLETEIIPEFYNYADFAEIVLDIFQEVQGTIEMEVDYNSKKFNPITIKEVFDI